MIAFATLGYHLHLRFAPVLPRRSSLKLPSHVRAATSTVKTAPDLVLLSLRSNKTLLCTPAALIYTEIGAAVNSIVKVFHKAATLLGCRAANAVDK